MVPMRGVFEHMDAKITWDDQTQAVDAVLGPDSIRMPIGSYSATVNGKQMGLDAPATLFAGRTMVPLRFLSETLHANVEWLSGSRTVEITTTGSTMPVSNPRSYSTARIVAGTVIPFILSSRLSSNGSKSGDAFKATLDASAGPMYQGLANGTGLEGHVDVARSRSGKTPGVLGLAFDRITMPDGHVYGIQGSLIGLDSKSVEMKDGRMVAKAGAKNDNLKYVGYGAGAGALISILTKGNIISNTLIGAALGLVYGQVQKTSSDARDVALVAGSKFGVKLSKDFIYPVEDLR
jgi:hypothetical protein